MVKDNRPKKTSVTAKGASRRQASRQRTVPGISSADMEKADTLRRAETLAGMLETLKPHDHLCLIYESKEEWRNAIIPFLAIGLRQGEKCLYIIDTSTTDEIRTYLVQEGVDVTSAERSGQLIIIHQAQAYTREGSFDPDKVIALLISETQKAIAEGYPALRVTGEMTWILRGHPGSEKLLEYEARLNTEFFPYHACLAICQYDRWKFDPEIIKGVIMTHPILARGDHVYHNFYYMPPEEFLNNNTESEVELWLNNVQRENLVAQELYESRQKYLELIENLNSGLAVYEARNDGQDFIFIDFNRAGERIDKITRDKVIGRSVLEVFPAVKKFGLFGVFQRVWHTGQPERHVAALYKDGRIFGWRDNYVYKLPSGEIAAIYDDVTELKTAEKALQESEEKFNKAFNTSPNMMAITTFEEGRIVEINENFCKMLGLKREEWVGRTTGELGIWATPEDRKRTIKLLKKKGVVSNVETDLRLKSGETHSIIYSLVPISIGDTKYLLSVLVDITKRKRAEEAIRESEEKFAKAFRSSPSRVVITRLKDGRFIDVNDSYLRFSGYSREDVIGRTTDEIGAWANPDDRKKIIKALKKEGRVAYQEVILRLKSGAPRTSLFSAELITIGGEECMISIATDISERKRMEEALRESEENFRRTIEGSPLGIMIVNDDAEAVYVNRALLDIYGYSSFNEFKNNPIEKRLTPESYAKHQIREETRKRGDYITPGYEIDIVRKDGSIRHLEVLREAVLWDKQTQSQVIFHDVTERNQLEVELQNSEKLESLGILAGGIAHDFNNYLTGITGNISLAKRLTEPKGKVFERLEEAEKASFKARDLTQQLLTFSRGGTPVKKIIPIGHLVQEAASFVLRGSNVKPKVSLPPDLWAIEADEGQINQVFNNIIINADQAMPKGGTLNIGIKNLAIKQHSTFPLPPGKYVEIAIIDHGIGISKKYVSRIFDPFFTTKQKGSGLGLTTAYSIVKNHGGIITVESRPGSGTTFNVYLPASEKHPPQEKEIGIRTTITGQGKILVMDDEEIVREMLRHMLGLAGYEVELSRGGAEAIERYVEAQRTKRPFDAVIMDLTIPGGMGGKEAIKKLLDIDPSVKVIVSSGYATDPIMSEYKKHGFSAVVAKPYSASELEQTLKKVLTRK